MNKDMLQVRVARKTREAERIIVFDNTGRPLLLAAMLDLRIRG